MMPTLADLFYDADTFLALEPEDVAAILMEAAQQFRAPPQSETGWPIFWPSPVPYSSGGGYGAPGWPSQMEQAVMHAWEEAIGWLKREGLVMSGLVGTTAGPGKLVFTRRGLQMKSKADVARYREASALPRTLVHEAIAERVIPQFLRGDRDSAVSYAFREVEIAVRKAAKFDQAEHGMPMMRNAFKKLTGPLADTNLPEGEQEAEQALFSGAIGHGRNPVSHRNVDMSPAEAARLILLASHLLSIVEKRPVALSDNLAT